MKPSAFIYHRPSSLDQALALLAEHGDGARPIAGGQSLVPLMNLRLAQPAHLVDLNDLAELDYVRQSTSGLLIGARTTHQTLAESDLVRRHCPLLAEAAATIGHYAIRQRGTIGGSLAHADPAAQLALVAVTLGARIELASGLGRRMLPAAEFLRSAMSTAAAPDELIVAVNFPGVPAGAGNAFRHFNRRQGDFAIASAAACVNVQGGRIERLQLGVGCVGHTPESLGALAAAQAGRLADASWIDEVAARARALVQIPAEGPVPLVFRSELTEVMVARALAAALQRCGAIS